MSIQSQLLVKILPRSDKEKPTFKAIKKHRCGLWKTLSKHLELRDLRSIQNLGSDAHPPSASAELKRVPGADLSISVYQGYVVYLDYNC